MTVARRSALKLANMRSFSAALSAILLVLNLSFVAAAKNNDGGNDPTMVWTRQNIDNALMHPRDQYMMEHHLLTPENNGRALRGAENARDRALIREVEITDETDEINFVYNKD
eukprot:scaffold53451_cov41-Attheya_sp.AAC.2